MLSRADYYKCIHILEQSTDCISSVVQKTYCLLNAHPAIIVSQAGESMFIRTAGEFIRNQRRYIS
jgi:hypothetical protein